MDREHYNKVKRVLDLSAAVFAQLSKKLPPAAALTAAPEACKQCWESEFPSSGYKPPKPLDLSGADFTKRLFAVHFFARCLEGANLRDATLDGTVWTGEVNDVDFSGAHLRGAHLELILRGAVRFRSADLSGSTLLIGGLGANAKLLDLSDANLTAATIVVTSVAIGLSYEFSGAEMAGCQVRFAPAPGIVGDMQGPGWGKGNLDKLLAALSVRQRSQIVLEQPQEAPAQSTAGEGCFIATAACGTDHAPDVTILRQFRETVLRNCSWGRIVIRLYEAGSPPIARVIAGSHVLRAITRTLLVRPAAVLAKKWRDRGEETRADGAAKT
jgi:hypothetical protein